jgi:hypothetical protein
MHSLFSSSRSLQPAFADQTQGMLATDTTSDSVDNEFEDDDDEWEV